MNKLTEAFRNKKAVIGFMTAGDPTFEQSITNILALAEGGADILEIGIPFSDPIAEGPVIQKANIRALGNGMTTDRIFELIKRVREKVSTPICLITYLNPVFKYGYERFFADCEAAGVDGIFVPDMPFEERPEALDYAKAHGITIIPLIAPAEEERIKAIAESAEGYIYVASAMSEAGLTDHSRDELKAVIDSVRKYTDLPTAVWFGIHTAKEAKRVSEIADGVIVESSVVDLVTRHGDKAAPYIAELIESMKIAVG
ncbi:MAG: tryptophan synthase subunit alpha [Oscillospiraceae bacterium]|nr:tryptophan synthase subunit alpha [Oscillospiraceae bacterium]